MSFRADEARGASWSPGGAGMPGAAVDYRLARNSVVSEFRKGRLSRRDVCDAHPELLRAAHNVGAPTAVECPICETGRLVHVTYVFGSRLPASGRCVTSMEELARLDRRREELACYVVEVCPECSWNHLARMLRIGRAARS